MTYSESTQTIQAAQATGLILLAHGSRDPLWRAPMEAVRAVVLAQQPHQACICAYLEACAPDLADATQQLYNQGLRRILVLPLFLGTGKHAREDIPRQLQQLQTTYPDTEFLLQPAIGEHPQVIALLANLALQAAAIGSAKTTS